jgi:hypothetical protein
MKAWITPNLFFKQGEKMMKRKTLFVLPLIGAFTFGAFQMNATAAGTEETAQAVAADGNSLLPPAQPGECYTRVLIPARFETETVKMLKKAAGEKIELLPGEYGWDEEKVLVEEASSRLVAVPGSYSTEKVTYQISDGRLYWATSLKSGARPVSDALLNAAKADGIDIDAATPGMCFHEHVIVPKYKNVTEKVLVKEASERVEIIPAKYDTVEKKILVKEASYKLVNVPETYKTVSEKILVEPATTVWKKGTKPVERVDNSTGEIVCLVNIPAKYKTVTRRVVDTPATTKRVEIPAVYKTVKVRTLVSPAQEKRIAIPAEYSTITKRVLDGDATFHWHEIHDKSMSKESRTGNQICLREISPKTGSYTKQVVASAPSVKTVELPAKYKTIKISKLVVQPTQKTISSPAQYQTVTKRVKVSEEHMEWVPILCEINFNLDLISELQRKLQAAGYNPGTIDGVYGGATKAAVRAFQRKNGMPTGQLTIETLKALGVAY